MGKDIGSYMRNINSQNGEDGIIEELLMRLKNAGVANDEWCVEFGAWDGIYLSNTYTLIKDKGYKAVLIEGDPKKHELLCKNIPQKDVYKICQFVGFDGDSCLDRILSTTPIPQNFDLLSIDIDGCDYYIFESLKDYSPKIICIEYNPSIPNEVEYIQERNFSIKRGASAKSLVNLANHKNYSLVAVTACNIFFIHNDFSRHVQTNQPILENLRDDSNERVFLFSGYDGTVLSNKKQITLNWHCVHQNISDMQYLPKSLRIFYTDYSKPQRLLFFLWLLFRHPATFMEKLRAKINQLCCRR